MTQQDPGTGGAVQLMSLAEVEELARRAHAGQLDKAGRPYAEHLASAAAETAARGGDEEQVAAAWLHDTVEDGVLTAEWLEAAPLTRRTKDIVMALTKRPGEPLEDYAARILATPGAVAVKDGDLDSNSAPRRLALLPDAAQRARLTAKYDRTRRLIHPGIAHHPPLGSGAPKDPDDATVLAALDRDAGDSWATLRDYAKGWAVEPEDVQPRGMWIEYGPRVDAVHRSLAGVRAVTPVFGHWMDFTHPDLALDGTLTPADAVRTATAVIRGDRFSEGTIATAWLNGRLFAVVRALVAWQDSTPR